jgi:hypothetical protein
MPHGSLTRRRALLLAVLLAGCASLTPADEVHLRGAQRLTDAAADAYAVAPVRWRRSRAGRAAMSGAGSCWGGRSSPTIPARPRSRTSWRTTILGHPEPTGPRSPQEELDANAKSVEIMVRAWGAEQSVAFQLVAAHLRALSAQPVTPPRLSPLRGAQGSLPAVFPAAPSRARPMGLGCTQVRG